MHDRGLDAEHHHRPADLVDRDFAAIALNRPRVAETYIATFSGTDNVAFVFDDFSA